MTYRDHERARAIESRDRIFDDPGDGPYAGENREFVLNEPRKNLWHEIRDEAIEYFHYNKIKWWSGEGDDPTGHLLSSQVACINHLFPIRQRQELATRILKAVDPSVETAAIVDDGYVEFEFIGSQNYLNEKRWGTRGANCTSIDAAMIGIMKDGDRCLFLIEWKYTEYYGQVNKYIRERAAVYDHLIQAPDSPFDKDVLPQAYYFEPFYQLMRQTLLGRLLAKNNDHECSQYRHIHVVPAKNHDLLERVTSPELRKRGKTLSEVWRSVLVDQDLYISISPENLLSPLSGTKETQPLLGYLNERYWQQRDPERG